MEEIIPFLVFVFWIVMNLLGQKRKAEKRKEKQRQEQRQRDLYKPEKPQPKPTRKPAPPIIFETEDEEVDILEEILGKKREEPTPSYTPPPVKFTGQNPVSAFEDPATIELKEKQIAQKMKQDYEKELANFKLNINKAFQRKNVHRKKSTKGRYSKAIVSDFSLKKAVIFSEILNRPYK